MTVSAQAIEKDLAELWKTDTQDAGLHRVYTTNLVAYAPNPEEAKEAESILLELVGHHPGRYILVRPATGDPKEPLSYEVSGHCLFRAEKGKTTAAIA